MKTLNGLLYGLACLVICFSSTVHAQIQTQETTQFSWHQRLKAYHLYQQQSRLTIQRMVALQPQLQDPNTLPLQYLAADAAQFEADLKSFQITSPETPFWSSFQQMQAVVTALQTATMLKQQAYQLERETGQLIPIDPGIVTAYQQANQAIEGLKRFQLLQGRS